MSVNSLEKYTIVLLLCALTLSACGKSSLSSDSAQVQQSVQRLSQGQVVTQINSQNNSMIQTPAAASTVSSPEIIAATPTPLTDGCPKVSKPAANATDAEIKTALQEFADCASGLYENAGVYAVAINVMKSFDLGTTQSATLSSHSVADLKALLGNLATKQKSQPPQVRIRFSDAELADLTQLAKLKLQEFQNAQLALFSAMEVRTELMVRAQAISNRYQALSILKSHVAEEGGAKKADLELAQVATTAQWDGTTGLGKFLYPYGAVALFPKPGAESAALGPLDSPYLLIDEELGNLGGPEASVQTYGINPYKLYRNQDNPPMPTHAPAASGAVRVAIIDYGIDFTNIPDLGLFLATPDTAKAGGLNSYDFADQDSNPWTPAVAAHDFEHGSGTAGTVLSLMARLVPDVMTARKLDLAMWKVGTIRNFLAGNSNHASWDSNYALQSAVVETIENHTGLFAVKPDIISYSLGGSLEPYLEQTQETTVLQKSASLWVMAAGNSGVSLETDLKAGNADCFSDVPAARRPSARILCVGALKQGQNGSDADSIASYSNFGDQVDLYTYDTFYELCPNGTSCAAPAITAAAAAIKARFPLLKAEQVRQVLLDSSETRTLPVSGTSLSRIVKVFDPQTMLDAALLKAAATATQN